MNALLFLCLILLIASTVVLLSLASAQVSGQAGIQPLRPARAISDAFIRIIIGDVPGQQYATALASLLNVFIAIVSIMFAVVFPVWAIYKQTTSKSLRIYRIFEDGVDDLKVMLKYYRGAENVTVFSGDFDWVSKNPEVRKEISRLSREGKISLISYKSDQEVQTAFGDDDFFQELRSCFQFNSGREAKCSYVKHTGTSVFLYKFKKRDGGEMRPTVGAIHDSEDTRYLLQVLENLCHRN